MPNTPQFSVIMPVYNQEAFLSQAVSSILGQTFNDWELIIVDDGSTDRSAELLRKLKNLDGRILTLHQANAGPGTARNRGIDVARAPWIAYLDSDDIWFPTTLQVYADYLARDRKTQFIFGHAHRLRGAVIEKCPAHDPSKAYGTVELFQHIFLANLALCHRKELWQAVGGFNPLLRCCEDYDFYLRMSLETSMMPIPQCTGLRRRHDKNLSQLTGRSQWIEAEMLARFAQQNAPVVPADLVRRRMHRVYSRGAHCFFNEGDFDQVMVMAQKALSLAFSWRMQLLCWRTRMRQRITPKRRAA